MKPNGKYFVVRAALFVLCMAGLFTAMANAETAHGKFKLTTETRWGKMLLAPGEYEFTLNTSAAGAMVTIRSESTGWSGMILPEGISDPAAPGSNLYLGQSQQGSYVESLALGDLGVMLNFGAPKAGKVTRLMVPQSTEVASASGSH
jgi:hypothetical protein